MEVMIAILIIAIGIGSILISENNSLDVSFRAQRMQSVAMLARNTLIQTEHDLEGKSLDEGKEQDGGKFDVPFAEYSWETKIKKIEFPNLMESLANSGGSGSGGSSSSSSSSSNSSSSSSSGSSSSGSAGGSSFQGVTSSDENITKIIKIATNYLSKSTREITVTIKWKEKGKEQSYSVSQYWVDLNHEFKMDTE